MCASSEAEGGSELFAFFPVDFRGKTARSLLQACINLLKINIIQHMVCLSMKVIGTSDK